MLDSLLNILSNETVMQISLRAALTLVVIALLYWWTNRTFLRPYREAMNRLRKLAPEGYEPKRTAHRGQLHAIMFWSIYIIGSASWTAGEMLHPPLADYNMEFIVVGATGVSIILISLWIHALLMQIHRRGKHKVYQGYH